MWKIQKKNKTKEILIITKDLDKKLVIYNSTKSIIDKLAAFKRKKCIKYINLTKDFLSDVAFLKFADFLLKNSKGVHLNIGKVNNLWFNLAAESIATGQYKFDIIKCAEILQFSIEGMQKTNVMIPNVKEKILQQAMAILLEMIYEKDHANFNKSISLKWTTNCHAVLHQIKHTWFCLPYYIQIKLGQIFTKTHCHILINILKKKISDKRFIDLMCSMYNNFLLCPAGFFFKNNCNKLQNNSFSFILCNIFLIEFDDHIKQKILMLFAKNLKKRYNIVKDGIGLNFHFPYHLKKCNKKTRGKKFKKYELGLNFLNKTENFTLKYVRYLDNCLFGLNGSYDLVFKIKQRIENFLHSNYHLKFKIDEIKIINTYINKVKFLGMIIFNQKLETLLAKKRMFLNNTIFHYKKNFRQNTQLIQNLKLDIRKNIAFALNRKTKFYRSKLKDLVNLITPCINLEANLKSFLPTKHLNPIFSNYLFFFKILNRVLMQYLWYFLRNLCKSFVYISLISKTCSICLRYLFKSFYIEFANFYSLSKCIKLSLSLYQNFISMNRWGCLQNLFLQQIKPNSNNKFLTSSKYNKLYNILPFIYADIEKIYKNFILLGILNSNKKPMCNLMIISENDFFLIQYYNNIGLYLLNYFRCVDNFNKIQNIVNFFLRFSLIATLKHKHKLASSEAVIKKFGFLLSVYNLKGNTINFLTTEYIFKLKKSYLLYI